MKNEEQKTNAQLSVLDAQRGIRQKTVKNISLLMLGTVATALGLWFGGWVMGITIIGSFAFFDYIRRRLTDNPIIEARGQSLENVLRSRLAKLKYGDHPVHGEKTAELYERYIKIFKQSEKILYSKLNPEELTSQRFQKLFDEMKENLDSSFEKLAQTLELSNRTSLDQTSVLKRTEGIEKDLLEIEKTMETLQQTQIGQSVSTFDQGFLIEEMKKLTARMQKLQ